MERRTNKEVYKRTNKIAYKGTNKKAYKGTDKKAYKRTVRKIHPDMAPKWGIYNLALDLIFPGRCPVCDKIIKFRQEYVCAACLEKIKFVREPACMKCGKPLEEETEYCFDCARKKHFYIKGAAVFEYASMASCIYRFKYGGRQEYAGFLGRCMAKRLKKELEDWKPEALIPVPVHTSRRRKRGYNQSELLAEALSRQTGIPVRKDIVKRVKKTVPQKELDIRQRQNNLKKAFKIIENDVKLNTIVIIDDIYTTGSTVDAMAAVLQEAGIKNIYYAALAVGRGL